MQVNVAGIRRNIKNIACNYTEAQIKVREATSNDPWGPSAVMLSEIADLTFNVVEFPKIMEMIWRRLNDSGKNWRHVKKSLILMEYLIKTGVEKCVRQCKENIFAIEALKEFTYYEDGKDFGRQVREKAIQLVNLLKDNERLRNERCKALKTKERFTRFSTGIGYNDVLPVAMPNSEIESVRPKTFDEEELQIKLALDISREEAQQEQLKRRTDDVRLRLALEQSERDFQERQRTIQAKEEPQSHLVDLLDISLGAASSSRGLSNADPWTNRNASTSETWPSNPYSQTDPWQPIHVANINRNTCATPSFESSFDRSPYGWVNRNNDVFASPWTPLTTLPSTPPTTVNSSALQESFAASNCNNNFFIDFDKSSIEQTFNASNNGSVIGSATNPNKPDSFASPSTLNPFL